MKKSVEEIVRGLREYVDREMGPKLSSWKRMALCAYVALATDSAPMKLRELMTKPAIEMLGLGDGDAVDVEKAYMVLRDQMNGKAFDIELPLIGTYRADVDDLDKVYTCIMEA